MDINTLRIGFTLICFAIFAGIIVWALSPANQRRFDEAANIPLDDGALQLHGADGVNVGIGTGAYTGTSTGKYRSN